MTAYRRNFVPGGCFFFTVNLVERKLSLLTDHVELLRAAFRGTRRRHPTTIDAIVVLPDHLHTVWTLPEGDADFAMRWPVAWNDLDSFASLYPSYSAVDLARRMTIASSALSNGINKWS